VSQYYETDPNDPEAPIPLTEYRGLRPGMNVTYQNPHAPSLGLPGPLIVDELIQWNTPGTPNVQAVLNGGEYEVNADNLRPAPFEQ